MRSTLLTPQHLPPLLPQPFPFLFHPSPALQPLPVLKIILLLMHRKPLYPSLVLGLKLKHLLVQRKRSL